MKVLVQNPYMVSGGAETRIRSLLQALIRRQDIDEVHFMFAGLESAHEIQAQGKMHLWQIRTGRTKKLTKNIIDKYGIDVVQFHNNQILGTDGVKYAQEQGIPTIWVMHDFWTICPQRFMTQPFNADNVPNCYKVDPYKCINDCAGRYEYVCTKNQRDVIEKCDVGIVPSEKIKSIFEMNDFMKGKLHIVDPWIDLSTFHPNPDVKKNPYMIFFAGNFIPHKGIKTLLKAMDIVNRRLPQARLVAQGDSRGLDNVINYSKLLGLQNINLIEHIPQDKLRDLYNESAVTVFPSIWEETIGLIWIESLACGTPVICSKTGSIPELLKYGGEMYEPKNHVELAEKLIDLLLSPTKRAKLANEGYQYVTTAFKPERAADDFAKLYYGLEAKRNQNDKES